MNNPTTPFTWTIQREDAARLIAEGALTLSEIARRLGISRQTLYDWRENEQFKERIQYNLQQMNAVIEQANLKSTIDRYKWRQELFEKLREIIDQITYEELLEINPIAAINLALRLDASCQKLERTNDQRYIPSVEGIGPEQLGQIMEVLDRAGAIGRANEDLSRPQPSRVHRKDDELQTS